MDKGEESVLRCRELLETLTPLRGDCGAYCGAACCRSLPGEETGMLLFPGEEALYWGREAYRLRETAQGTLLICEGTCRREERPLACRLFPLLPLLRGEEIRVAVDARARAVCPLRRVDGCRGDFVEAVRQAGRILAEDEAQRAFLLELTRVHDDLRALQKTMGG